MKFNLAEKIRQTIRKTSISSRVLFLLTVVSGVLWLSSNMEESFFLLTGLMGVLWLSSIALHAFRRGTTGRHNPFTALIALCASVSLICLGISWVWNPDYDEAHEPINLIMESYRRILNDDPAEDLTERGSYLFSFSHLLNGTESNLILTDKNNQVISRENQWMTGNSETVRALICPAYLGNGQELMILVDGKGNVLGAFLLEKGYSGNHTSSEYSYNPLTIPEDTASSDTGVSGKNGETDVIPGAEDAAENAEEVRDPLYERYFPSFGPAIDRAAIELAYKDSMKVGEGLYQSFDEVTIFSWKGENVIEDHDMDASLVRELNSLTADQRKKLQEYLTWLRQAMNAARNADGDYDPFYARILTRDDGAASLIMLYKYDQETLRPRHQSFIKKAILRENVQNAGVLMIPAIIVFLSFWVFVDAKKRGHSAPALWAVLTLIGNVIAWIIYMLVRPQMMKTAAGQPMPRGACPICGTKLKSDFIACPGCGILLRNRCKNCGRALENDWSFCPYCTTAVVRELPEAETGESVSP